MHKLLLLSVLAASFWLPLRAAKLSSMKRGFREATIGFSIFCVLYLIALVVYYPTFPTK
jgi:hypothetical protein